MTNPERVTLRAARERRQLTQAELAARTRVLDEHGRGVNQRRISDLERRRVREPKHRAAVLLERALDLQPGSLDFTVSA